ncbi:hypothetical protein [Paenibacillus amylolyticus]|uniref:hypothetical protein n=1 Tax=Paenibacillus amylolyticus TaxID=1451 RepID=UPI00096C9EBE|nr:hypothetical protein [Paenibacillus amylolyticus]OMF45415.1 hypothetical protein BK136_09955 [Paenibacillus amylolyticus]
MTKDLILAEKNNYSVHLRFMDGTSFSGNISLTSNKSHVKVQTQGETAWIPIEEIIHCSITIPGPFGR